MKCFFVNLFWVSKEKEVLNPWGMYLYQNCAANGLISNVHDVNKIKDAIATLNTCYIDDAVILTSVFTRLTTFRYFLFLSNAKK